MVIWDGNIFVHRLHEGYMQIRVICGLFLQAGCTISLSLRFYTGRAVVVYESKKIKTELNDKYV